MDSSELGVVAFLGAWVTTIGGVWFLFEKADETLAPEVRERLSDWLMGVSAGDRIRRWPDQFIALFDRAFGARHLSWLRLRRSALATFVLTWIVAGWWMTTHPPPSASMAGRALLLVTGASVIFSIVADYLSLIETRWVLDRLSGGGAVAPWLLFDIVATAVLGLSIYMVVFVSVEGPGRLPSAMLDMLTFEITMAIFDAVHDGTTGQSSEVVYAMPMAPFFYATFFTSLWVWLFVAASGLVRVATVALQQTSRLRGILDVRDKPGRSLGLAAVGLVTLFYAATVPVWLVWRLAT